MRKIKGSFTVEAAFIMPLFVAVLVFVIYIGFYYYNISASIYGCYMEGTTIVRESQEDQGEDFSEMVIAMDNPSISVEQNAEEVVMSANGTMKSPFVNKRLSIWHKGRYVQLDQRGFIMKCKFLQGLFQKD